MERLQYSSDIENQDHNASPALGRSNVASASKSQTRKIEQLKEELQVAAEIGKNLLLSEAEKARKIEILQDSLTQLRTQSAEQQRAWAEEKDSFNCEIAELKEECGQLKQRNSQLALRLEAAMKDSQEMLDEHLKSVTKAKASESELHTLRQRLVSVQSSTTKLSDTKLHKASPITPPFHAKRDLFQSRTTPDGQMLTPMSGSHNGGTPQDNMISKLQEELNVVKSRNKTYNNTVIKLHNKLADMETRNLDSTKKLKAAEQEIGEYRLIKEAHAELLGSYKIQLDTKADGSSVESASLAASLLKDELSDSKAELNKLKEKLVQSENQAIQYKEQVQNLLYPRNRNAQGPWIVFLQRKSNRSQWKTRYCRVKEEALENFHNEWESRPSSRLSLNGYEVRVCRRRHRSASQRDVLQGAIEFYLWHPGKRVITLRSRDEKGFLRWVYHFMRETNRETYIGGYLTVNDRALFAVIRPEGVVLYKQPTSRKPVLKLPLTRPFTIAMDTTLPSSFQMVYSDPKGSYSINTASDSDCRWWIETIMSVKSKMLNWEAALKRIVCDYRNEPAAAKLEES